MRGLAFLAAYALAGPAFATVTAPIPRGIDFDNLPGKPAPPADDGEAEDPAALAERIAKAAGEAADRLQEKDTGAATREKQEQLLKDIDKLLKPPPPQNGGGSDMPPPQGGGGSGGGKGNDGSPPPMGGGNDSKSGGMPPPQGGMGQPMPMGGQNSPMPMGSTGNKPRPQRTGSRPEPMPGTPNPMGMGKNEPLGGAAKAGLSGMGDSHPMGKAGGPAAPPLEDPFTKRVWGHLPEKLRQQASQFYREQYMPKYNELLKLYYSNLAEREKK